MTTWPDLAGGLASRVPSTAQVVAFPVRRIRSARVIWLNDRWFAEQGIDIACRRVRAEIYRDLEHHFGVISCERQHADALLNAEMYGVTAGSIHGGGGRSGGRQGLHAKGVGRTPLAARNTDFHHSHGSLWLYEAVREIIASEVVAAELPHGSVPIIALLDTMHDVDVAGSSEIARRALIVRPDFVRPGSFERSIFFGSAGHSGSDQVRDAARVQSVVKEAAAGTGRFAVAPFSFADMTAKIIDQLGAGRALRLWQGQFSSANLSTDGAWNDFGAFCALPDWRRSERVLGECFGNEQRNVAAALHSIAQSIAKYGGCLDAPAPDAVTIEAGIDRSFRATVARELDLSTLPTEQAGLIAEMITAYFRSQQRLRVANEDGVRRSWLGDITDGGAEATGDRLTARFIEYYLAGRPPRERHLHEATARRFFRPRTALYQGAADRQFKKRVNATGTRFDYRPVDIVQYIEDRVGESRRAWRDLGAGTIVRRQWQCGSGSIREVWDAEHGGRWVLQGVRQERDLRVGRDKVIAEATLRRGKQIREVGLLQTFAIDADDVSSAEIWFRNGEAPFRTAIDWTVRRDAQSEMSP